MKKPLNVVLVIIILFLLFAGKSNAAPAVKVEGRALLVDFDGDGKYRHYLIKGIGYQAVPIGRGPHAPEDPEVLERDFSLLRKMNCNTIRTWGEVNKILLDYAQKYGLKVIAGFKPYPNELDFSSPANRAEVIEKFKG
ncbi:MAG: hypothetical protein U9R52_04850, partial [Candidatus Omnitrophota bacterium]|nr:hypothetical protein [Candidatus Omnitrophota bacterium]